MKKRMLYIMGIDWQWIYQRPQILAKKLALDYEITVVFPRSVTAGKKEKPVEEGVDFRILWTLPYQEKNPLIGKISEWMNAKIWKDIDDFEAVFIGYPLYSRYIPENYEGKIIYDCMDNHEALYPDQKRVERVIVQEQRLIKRCDVLMASAKLLQEKVDSIAGTSKSVLVRNGVTIEKICRVGKPKYRQQYSLCYIGTIAEWFDLELLTESLKWRDNITYQLIGPAIKRVEHPGIVYHGPVEHDKLEARTREYDCLIMPFVVNEIVASVDPVKLYEYIAFGKCIISVYYPEIERFRDFVYFYESHEEYLELLEELAETGFPAKYDEERQREFLRENSWDRRYDTLRTLLEK